jgi:hypothetical protein
MGTIPAGGDYNSTLQRLAKAQSVAIPTWAPGGRQRIVISAGELLSAMAS